MKVMERNVMRLVAVQHLRAAYGIKTKNWNKNKAASCKSTASHSTKVFGVSLESLPYYNMGCGSVPSFLVDACMMLLAHVDTEGLFRKSGSVIRLKALRAKLDAGEECLSTALPCDVAGLVKQFFRELPEPVLPTELQEAFLKAQQLPAEEDGASATMLLTCVLPDRNLSVLRHFFDFLQIVSKRCAENKMDSSNLSVILAPNILHAGDGTEKMNANTEKRLKLQAAILHCFIENAHTFGVLPQFLLEKVPAMMGCEARVLSPADGLQELDLNSGMKKRQRRSFGVFSSATPVIATPTSKRKLPLESGHSFGFSNKRRSVKKTLGIDLLPNTLFSGTSTPGSAYSASGVLDSSQTTVSSAGKSRKQSAVSARRKSQRLSSRHAVNRVESGRAGCFSPKVDKKEGPRKSLRLRFSLGRSSKEAGSESIGWRLATQESTTSFRFTKDTAFSPSLLPRKAEPKSAKYISKSEDNLLTPHCDPGVHRTLWSGETPSGDRAFGQTSFTDTPVNMGSKSNSVSEPAIAVLKPTAAGSFPKKLCCASSAESLASGAAEVQSQTGPTHLEMTTAFTQSATGPQTVIQDPCSSNPPDSVLLLLPPGTPTVRVLSEDAEASSFSTRQSRPGKEQNRTFGQFEIASLSPLHIDSVVFEPGVYFTDGPPLCAARIDDGSVGGACEAEAEQANCSRLIDALDIQSPARFKLGVSRGPQSTPYKAGLDLGEEFGSPPQIGTAVCAPHDEDESSPESGARVQDQRPLSPRSLESEKRRVADHIHHFNELTLRSPRGAVAKLGRSPLKFQRTPVRQTVRRMNSLLGESRRPSRNAELAVGQSGPVVKAVSLESGLSPRPQLRRRPSQSEARPGRSDGIRPIKKPPPVPPRKPSTLARRPTVAALADMTNTVQPKTRVAGCAQKPVGEKDMNHYRGSPRNPISQVQLLSATKPVDL
ncbi:rho GTPase-activating protein 11A isoform X2 [Pseudoliparis swirei]|uniref:rho GTPase-activating protein 11A isoform X2 n=1 Tax=Pseudoliparis swirei TaxID=2059687 RepID=UPI0024BEFCE8|nr:rho GTPase-activating protein 11A isoform X2 [Pseudoliparis swirei]